MKKKFFTRALTLSVLASIVVVGCKKQENEDTDTTAAADNATSEAYFDDLGNIANEGAISGAVSSYKTNPPTDGLLSSCATVSFDTLNHADADSVIIDFGSSNCLCIDGRYRRGIIQVIYTGKYRDSGTVITTSPVNYFVNNHQLKGTRTVTNMGHNSLGNTYHSIVVSGQVILANGGGTITWNSNRQREWAAGESTWVWSDDVYSITGTASGTSSNGTPFTVSITSPLIRNMAIGCRRHFVQGTFDLTPQGRPTRTFDYGNGTCDNKATVTIKGRTYNITLR